MKNIRDMDFFDICITYRLVSLVISTLAYLGLVIYFNDNGIRKWFIAGGMCISCVLSSYLYSKVKGQKGWTKIIFCIEFFVYGIFIILSGGFSSPYFWYYICCLLISMLEEETYAVVLSVFLWYLVCILSGSEEYSKLHMQINIIVGMIIVIGSFGIIKLNSDLLKRSNTKLENLNAELKYENDRSAYAMFQLAAIYRSFDLLIINDKDKILLNLARLLKRTIAGDGCILLKTDMEGNIENIADYGMDSNRVDELLEYILAEGISTIVDSDKRSIEISDKIYELIPLNKTVPLCGIIIRTAIGGERGKLHNERCYTKLAEIVLHNVDTRKQMEDYISNEEKNRMANEIHDTVIQKLFGITCGLKEMEDNIENWSTDRIYERTVVFKKSVKLIMEELREAIYAKRFEDEGKGNLVVKLQNYIDETMSLNHVDIYSEIDETVEVLTPTQKIMIYRVTCEVVGNAIRHGQADKIDIILSLDEKYVLLKIYNNGTEFNDRKTGINRGIGIDNIKKMVVYLKGKMWIDTVESGRVLVYFKLPRNI